VADAVDEYVAEPLLVDDADAELVADGVDDTLRVPLPEEDEEADPEPDGVDEPLAELLNRARGGGRRRGARRGR
jgi:hypothetical protein